MKLNKSLSYYVLVLVLYILASFSMTFPLICCPNHCIYGIGHDNLGSISNNWIAKKIEVDNLNPKRIDYVNYPDGLDYTKKLRMYTADFLDSIILDIFVNPILSYNMLLLFKFCLASFAMFILLRYMIGDYFISFIVGFFYAFSPYFTIMSKAYNGNFIACFLPFCMWTLLRFIDNPKSLNLIYFLISYLIFFGENYYYSYFVSVTCFLSVITFYFFPQELKWGLFRKSPKEFFRRQKPAKIKLAILGSFIVIVICIFSFWLYEALALHIKERVFSLQEAISRSVDPMFYIVPSVTNSFLGDYFRDFAASRMRILEIYEKTVYLGIVPLLFIGVAFWKMFIAKNKSVSDRTRGFFILFSISALYSIILGLGPKFGLSYVFFKIAPMFRFICRYHVMTIFSILVLFAISLKLLSSLIRRKYLRYVMVVAVALGVFIEYADFGRAKLLNLYDHMPEVYKYLEKDKDFYPILEINTQLWPSVAHLMAYQAFHGKKILGGANKRFCEDILDEDVQKKFRDMGFKYVVIITKWKPLTYPPLQTWWPDRSINFEAIPKFGYLRLEKEFKDSLLYRFQKTKSELLLGHKEPLFYFGKGFYGSPGFYKNGDFRWMSSKTAVVKILVGKDSYMPMAQFGTRLKFTSRSFHIPRRVTLWVNGVKDDTLMISSNPLDYAVDLTLKEGVNTVVFKTNQELTNIDKTIHSGDPRDVSLWLGNFRLVQFLKS